MSFTSIGQLQNEAEHVKMSKIIDRYRPEGAGFVRIDTKNNMPTSAGLSSSSSGLSALVKACNAYFQLGLDRKDLALEAKFASVLHLVVFMAPWQPGTRIVERFILLKLT